MINTSIHGTEAVEFMAAQLIECVKQTHTNQIQVTIADTASIWKVTIEKVDTRQNPLHQTSSDRAA
jgi:hypothetical protein